MSSLWLLATAAPCVMAAPHCPGMEGTPRESMEHEVSAPDCDSLQAVDCQREDVALADRNLIPNLHFVPVLLTTVSLTVDSPAYALLASHPDRLAMCLSPPPLYLQHAALLT